MKGENLPADVASPKPLVTSVNADPAKLVASVNAEPPKLVASVNADPAKLVASVNAEPAKLVTSENADAASDVATPKAEVIVSKTEENIGISVLNDCRNDDTVIRTLTLFRDISCWDSTRSEEEDLGEDSEAGKHLEILVEEKKKMKKTKRVCFVGYEDGTRGGGLYTSLLGLYHRGRLPPLLCPRASLEASDVIR
jgi:hypothetical protein